MSALPPQLTAALPVLSRGAGFCQTKGGRLHWQAISPDRPAATVILIHGVGEHHGRHEHVAEYLAQNALTVFSFDLRGHGKSDGIRGHVDQWQDYLDDLSSFVQFIQGIEGDRPIFLWGHSMGALIALDYALEDSLNIKGVICNGIPLRSPKLNRPWMVKAVNVISKVMPTYALRLDLDLAALSNDAAIGSAYRADPAVNTVITARWGASICSAIDRLLTQALELDVSILITHGAQDTISLPCGSAELYGLIGKRDKTLKQYAHSRHEVHNDNDSFEYISDVCNWILPRAVAKTTQ